jgi:hypothetical protein
MLDELATVPGVRGVMLTFDDFIIGMEQFGTRILPLMHCRSAGQHRHDLARFPRHTAGTNSSAGEPVSAQS